MPDLSPEALAPGAALEPSQAPPWRRPTLRDALLLAALALGAYLLALVATLPASVALRLAGAPESWRGAEGSAWRGSLMFTNGVQASWRLRPFRSLLALSAVADVELRGAGTALTTRTTTRPGRLQANNLKGRVGPRVLASLTPSLPFQCEAAMQVDVARLVVGRGALIDGRLRTEAGACRTGLLGGNVLAPLPALDGVSGSGPVPSSLDLSPAGRPGELVAQISLPREGGLRMTVFPAGAALFMPGAPARALTLDLTR